jgi:hypothetical protein
MVGTAAVSLLQIAFVVVAGGAGGLDRTDGGFLAAQSPVPLKAVLSLGAADSLLPMDIPPIHIPPVGEGLVHLDRLVHDAVRRVLALRLCLGLGDALCLRRSDTLGLALNQIQMREMKPIVGPQPTGAREERNATQQPGRGTKVAVLAYQIDTTSC